MTGPKILPLDSAHFTVMPWEWPFARERRAEIDAHFAQRQKSTPELWNGRVLLLRDHKVDGRTLTGSFFETDFASFMTWRDFGFPDGGAINCFSMAAILASDNAWLLGVMGAHTANAGRTYFPAGTPDLNDVSGNTVDLVASVLREVTEEAGLTTEDLRMDEGWTAVVTDTRIALMKVMRAREPADILRARIFKFLAQERQPELADIHIVRSRADFTPSMPDFVTAFLEHALLH